MAKIHILGQDPKKDTVQAVYHIDIPDAVNSAGVNYQAALVEDLDPEGSGIASQVPNLAATDVAEFASLQAGAVYEAVHRVEFDANLTGAQKAASVDNDYLACKTSVLAAIQERLKYWGMIRNPV